MAFCALRCDRRERPICGVVAGLRKQEIQPAARVSDKQNPCYPRRWQGQGASRYFELRRRGWDRQGAYGVVKVSLRRRAALHRRGAPIQCRAGAGASTIARASTRSPHAASRRKDLRPRRRAAACEQQGAAKDNKCEAAPPVFDGAERDPQGRGKGQRLENASLIRQNVPSLDLLPV